MRGDAEQIWQAMKGSHYQRILEQLAKTIHEANDFQQAISAALGTVIKAMHAQTGTLWLYDRFGSGRIHPKAVFDGADLSGMSLAPGEGIAGQVVENGTSVIIKDCQADKRWASRVDSKTGFQTRTMICVPLSWQEQTFGCIQIINQHKDLLFDEKDLLFAESLAQEVIILLHNEGMLQGYISDIPFSPIRFQSLFCQGSESELEQQLREVPEYMALSPWEQQKVLRLSRKLYGCFHKHGFFGK